MTLRRVALVLAALSTACSTESRTRDAGGEGQPKPGEPKPGEPKPGEPKPGEPKPVETKQPEPKPVEPKQPEPGKGPGAPERRCFFDGDVTSDVRVASKLADGGLELALEWDATAGEGARGVPPSKIWSVEMPFGVECREPFDVMGDTGAKATATGDRAVRVELPKPMLDSLPGRCASRKLTVKLSLGGQYAEPCRKLEGDGLPFHVLSVEVTLAADGKATVDRVAGGSYLEG